MDIEVGFGGNNDAAAVVSTVPDPADPQSYEPQPFTWLHAAPFIVIMLAGVALLAVDALVLIGPSCSSVGADDETINNVKFVNKNKCDLGIVLTIIGGIMVGMGIGASTALICSEYCLSRLDQADD